MRPKVKVNIEVSDAINTLEMWIGSDKDISEKILKVAELISYGHEVVKTPEEIIKEKYEELFDYEPLDRACKDTFRFVLDTLNIKIKGVNEY